MKRVLLAILGAMSEEVEQIRLRLEEAYCVDCDGLVIHIGELRGTSVALMQCGVGKVNAALSAQVLLKAVEPAGLVFTGVAGSLIEGLRVGDVVVSTAAVQHDYDISMFRGMKGFVPFPLQLESRDPQVAERIRSLLGKRALSRLEGVQMIDADRTLRLLAIRAFDIMHQSPDVRGRLCCGIVASGDQFITDRTQREAIQREFGALCVEMEGAAVAYTCLLRGTPFVIVRTMSDDASGDAPKDFRSFLAASAQLSSNLVSTMCELSAKSVKEFREAEFKWIVETPAGETIAVTDIRSRIRAVVGKLCPGTEEFALVEVEDVYFDTAQQDLLSSDTYLRLRREPVGATLVFKSGGMGDLSSLWARSEVSRPVDVEEHAVTDGLRLGDLIQKSIPRDDLENMKRAAGIASHVVVELAKPVVRIENSRSILEVVCEKKRIGAISVDDFRGIRIGREGDAVCEIEVEFELEEEWVARANEVFIAKMIAEIKEVLPLRPSTLSKLRRVLAG